MWKGPSHENRFAPVSAGVGALGALVAGRAVKKMTLRRQDRPQADVGLLAAAHGRSDGAYGVAARMYSQCRDVPNSRQADHGDEKAEGENIKAVKVGLVHLIPPIMGCDKCPTVRPTLGLRGS